MMPLFLVRRADALAEVGLEVSLMPSGPLGMDSLPPMLKVRQEEGVWCIADHEHFAVNATGWGTDVGESGVIFVQRACLRSSSGPRKARATIVCWHGSLDKMHITCNHQLKGRTDMQLIVVARLPCQVYAPCTCHATLARGLESAVSKTGLAAKCASEPSYISSCPILADLESNCAVSALCSTALKPVELLNP
ncbi:hypothetical protein J1614_001751 [Plenodomus biglobosus]|nr:hypothetical protein J1614_001751 [Plenodomus biglobosus]